MGTVRGRGTGIPAVGALFTTTGTGLGKHFCTASVVDSPHRDLALTAAHCVTGMAPARVAFVPGYRDGKAPYGIWAVTRVIMDRTGPPPPPPSPTTPSW